MHFIIKNKPLSSWRIPIKPNMTYILAGKFNNESFLMVDTVVNNLPNAAPTEKMYRCITNNQIYLSLTGDEELMQIIQIYDYWLYTQGLIITFDLPTITTIAQLLPNIAALRNISLSKDQRIFVVQGNNVDFFDLEYNQNNYINSSHTSLPNDSIVFATDHVNSITNFIHNNFTNSRNLCQDILFSQCSLQHNPITYFINGFSFYSNLLGFSSYSIGFNQYLLDKFR
jgi:hypothetical protein